MKIILSHNITLSEAPDRLTAKIRSMFTIDNPQWLDNEKMGRWNGNTPRVLRCYQESGDMLTVPRGSLGLVLWLCKELNIRFHIEDERRTLQPIDYIFTGSLKPYQEKAVNDVLRYDFGVLQAPTGSGKTVMALAIIAERRQPCLIIVHSKELLNQWLERIEQFLNIPRSNIGIIGNGKKQIGDTITIGIINSLYPIAGDIKQHFGHIIVDECHRTPSRTFTKAVSTFDARYMLGLSATPYRRDGLTKLIGWYIGRTVKVNKTDLTERDIILNVEVITRGTDFIPWADPSGEYSKMLSELTEDPERNRLIVRDVLQEARNNNGVCLVLTDRKSHCETLYLMLQRQRIAVDVLTGSVSTKERAAIVARLNSGKVKVLIATGQLIGEGFDCKSLSSLFLGTPVKFDGRLIQYLGRVLRPATGKHKARIYDYVDPVGVLQASARARAGVYRRRP